MSILDEIKMYARFAWGLRGFLRETITLEEAKAIVRRRLAQRESNFLRLVEKGIFGYPRSPYLPLLKLARVELGDIQNMVRAKGLEDTLWALREAGVYVTFEEFKGREPIVRHGQVIPVQAHDFDNPHLSRYYYDESGGTTGPATRGMLDLDHLVALAPLVLLTEDAHALLDIPAAIWHGVLPDPTGLVCLLYGARIGHIPQKWFSPMTGQESRPSAKNHLATQSSIAISRLLGASLPWAKPVGLDQAAVVARWVAETLRTHGACLIWTHVSRALRVCLAAQEEGFDLTGATILGSGEPPTPAKVQRIISSGARFVPTYFFAEAGPVGMGCSKPTDCNDIHFFKDILALIQYPREVPGAEITVDAFHFTTLIPTAHKLLLNVENDDYGVMEHHSCGCPLESYGFTEHLRHIRSFSKLTGEGVTLVGSDMVHILEEVLPTRFGGSPLDYQLLEEEDEDGFTRLSLLVNPKIEIEDERGVIEAVLDVLGQSNVAADLAQAIWKQAGTLRVKRREPIWTARGKLMPLHMQRRSGNVGHNREARKEKRS